VRDAPVSMQLVFRCKGEILTVVAVAHAKRRPDYWIRRK
jgi:hypothetical protein